MGSIPRKLGHKLVGTTCIRGDGTWLRNKSYSLDVYSVFTVASDSVLSVRQVHRGGAPFAVIQTVFHDLYVFACAREAWEAVWVAFVDTSMHSGNSQCMRKPLGFRKCVIMDVYVLSLASASEPLAKLPGRAEQESNCVWLWERPLLLARRHTGRHTFVL